MHAREGEARSGPKYFRRAGVTDFRGFPKAAFTSTTLRGRTSALAVVQNALALMLPPQRVRHGWPLLAPARRFVSVVTA
jgi:hypothetical protein